MSESLFNFTEWPRESDLRAHAKLLIMVALTPAAQFGTTAAAVDRELFHTLYELTARDGERQAIADRIVVEDQASV